jgi:4-hydroxy-tetrahydrodipicolinate reductase
VVKIIINGCSGKMGRVLAETASADPEVKIVAGIDKNPRGLSSDFPVYGNIEEFKEKADVIVDFSRPDSILPLTKYAVNNRTALVIATTGLEKEHQELLEQAAKSVPVFQSANMSLGVNLVRDISERAAEVLGDSFDIEIVEFHHNQKVDAPSGTALMLAKAINEKLKAGKEFIYGRSPQSGKREEKEIGIHAIRGGTMPGEHSIIFAGQDEIIEIRHIALSRKIFALGALKAAKFIAKQNEGMYNMDHLIKQ